MTEDATRGAYDRLVQTLGEEHEGIVDGKAFGMPALKVNGKMFAGYYNGDMTFKLTGAAHAEALALSGAHLFDPSEMNRPMKEWVQVPAQHVEEWPRLAETAWQYVRGGMP